ncbi:M48 family metalloprotease [Methylicorpusculum oleiharenae]|uniref:M48 family metalloprotease n=1 Tax=Methylicorpusculum oleiharenae TaxID=1338687 RepID=UPI00135691E6|nr:M48 family metalloprotease [Methylicorpusculum oleiharenae]MCD2451231.1 M48 family metalloprotease [Methylicorpusculum oleiharenae]
MIKNPAKFFAVYLVLATYSAAALDLEPEKFNLPDIGDSSGTLISPVQEQELGEAFFRSLNSQIDVNQDVEIQEYIETIGSKLVANSDSPGNPFHFFVVNDNAINAFAGPGGFIGVNSGLILTTEAESELASVMAHEIAHVTQRHLYRAFEAASRLSIPTAAATLAAILLGTQSPELAQAAIVAVQASSIQFQIDFTRDNEMEADRVGMQTLANSKFDPRSMPIFFERLQQSSRYYGRGIPEFLRTHPVTSSRISDTRGRAEKYPYQQYPDSLGYLIAQAKLRVSTSHDLSSVQDYFKIRLNQGTVQQRAIARYGLGLVYLKQQQFNDAAVLFKQLMTEYPEQTHYVTAMAKTAQESRDYPAALNLYKKALFQFPGNTALKMDYISTLLKIGKPEEAREIMLLLTPKIKQSALYLKLLAQIYSDLQQPAESHRHLAEYYYKLGQNEAAIIQIKLAQKAAGLSQHLSAILDERLAFFINEERERKLDR